MVLSSDLISKFVKATKDEPQSKKETVVYGVVTQIEPDVRVKINNPDSDTLAVHGESIPVASQTTVVEVGDKVECTIKNHKLSITGTSEHPAARDSSTINVSQLNASNARIDNLESANIDVQDTLTAHNADIDNLKAANVDITGRLTAAEADIDYLQALDIDVETLNAAKAFVEDLKASNADINYLVSTVAEIDTLMFGSASGNVIQTSFSNAVIAQLGDAQIKSAMIESVSAGKITAGDIITNNVRVMSEDGSLIISDETLQISDSNRVRVQIGKDASNDYSINIWDQNGHLMFSKGGITDAAIKEAIIRNDMVSDTANIHASKLDIDSLFEEINGSSNTIKSTQVKLDDRNQTLDVAFKSLTNEISSQGNKISSQGTAISTIQGQISSKIWQQDINTAKNEMSTQYSTLEQEVDSFKTTVSETYATVSDLDNLEIGGRNLMINSEEGYSFAGKTFTNSTHSGTKVTCTVDGGKADHYCMITNYVVPTPSELSKEIGTEITFSADVKIVGTIVNPHMTFDLRNPGSQTKSFIIRAYANPSITDKWQRISGTAVIKDVGEITDSLIALLYDSAVLGSTIEYRKVKVERGNKATDWTAAPEDTETNITELLTKYSSIEQTVNGITSTVGEHSSKIGTVESSISQLSNRITSNVTETTNLGTRMTTVEQTANGLSVELQNLKIGGRNYATLTNLQRYTGGNILTPLPCWTVDDTKITATEQSLSGPLPGFKINTNGIYSYTISGYTDLTKLKTYHKCFDADGNQVRAQAGISTNSINGYFELRIDVPDTTAYFNIGIGSDVVSNYYIDKLKIEQGNQATDWTPNPEDITNNIINASKSATNYLNFSSSGLVIGDLTSSTLGKNVLIDSDSVDIRNGNTTLASFGADYLYLAKNSRNATIDLCNGLAKLYHQSRLSYDTLFVIETPNATEIRGTSDPLCVTSTVASKPAIKFANKDGVLGSIGMVASGTESYITRNHPSTAATYSILDTGNYYKIMDSGWFNGGVLGDNFTVYNDNSQVKYRKIGKQVQIMGTVKPRVDIEGSTTQHTIFTLPSGYRPPYALHQVCYGSNNYTWRLTVNTNGTVCFSRYGLDSGYVTAAVGHWINFQATFFID